MQNPAYGQAYQASPGRPAGVTKPYNPGYSLPPAGYAGPPTAAPSIGPELWSWFQVG